MSLVPKYWHLMKHKTPRCLKLATLPSFITTHFTSHIIMPTSQESIIKLNNLLTHHCGRPPLARRSAPFLAPGACERVLGKGSGEGLLAADLLAADETLDGDGDGAVDVLGGAVFGEAHAAEGFADADDGFEMTDLFVGVNEGTGKKGFGGQRTVMG